MRNELTVYSSDAAYVAIGELDDHLVTLTAYSRGHVSLEIGLATLYLSKYAADELARHLRAALTALDTLEEQA